MENTTAEYIVNTLIDLGLTIAIAESATGGLISNFITDISGSSNCIKGGIIAYDNDIKSTILGVRDNTLAQYGAVSQQTGGEMAKCIRKLMQADIGISDTGIAGPTGSTHQKPIGLFYIGLSTEHKTQVKEHRFTGDRLQNKSSAAQAALDMLKHHLSELQSKITDENHIVTAFLEHNGKICLLRRSHQVGTYKGRWAAVSGFIETKHTPFEQALQEIREETKLANENINIIAQGKPLVVLDEQLGKKWIVHPFRFTLSQPDKIQIDWEHTDLTWISPQDIHKYETVPKLSQAWDRVASL